MTHTDLTTKYYLVSIYQLTHTHQQQQQQKFQIQKKTTRTILTKTKIPDDGSISSERNVFDFIKTKIPENKWK